MPAPAFRSAIRRALLLLPAALFAAVPLRAEPSAARPLRIAVIGPFSGPSADFGLPMLQGVRLAAAEINAVGGYLGRHLELSVKDDRGDPETGQAEARAAIREGVVAAIGFCNTGVALRALPVFHQARVPLIVPCSTGTPVTRQYPPAQSYIFRTSAPDAVQAPFVVEDILRRGWSRVAIFADNTGYGEAGLADVQEALRLRGLSPAHVERFPLGVQDLRKELRRARDAGADVIFSYTVGPENAVIATGRREIGWKVPMAGAWPLSFPFFIEGAKGAAEGALMAQTFIAEPSNERRAAFLSAYGRHFGGAAIPVPVAAAQAYDAAYLLMYALLGIRDGDLRGPRVKHALENIARVYYGVVATYDKPFSARDKDAITADMLVMGQVKGGRVGFAYPEDARRNLFVRRKTTRVNAQPGRASPQPARDGAAARPRSTLTPAP